MTGADILIAAGIVTATISAGYAVARVVRSFWAGFKHAVVEATSDIRDDLANHGVRSDERHAENVARLANIERRVAVVETDLKVHMKDVAEDRLRNEGDGK